MTSGVIMTNNNYTYELSLSSNHKYTCKQEDKNLFSISVDDVKLDITFDSLAKAVDYLFNLYESSEENLLDREV